MTDGGIHMRQARPLWLLLLVVVATAAAVHRWWPDPTAALGVAFVGLLLLHIHTFARLRWLERRGISPLPSALPSAAGGGTRIAGTGETGRGEVGERREPAGGRGAGGRGAGALPGRVVKPSAEGEDAAPGPREEPERVEDFLKVVLKGSEDAEEISFLPPYASDEADAAALDISSEPVASGGPPEELHLGDLDVEPQPSASPGASYGNVPIPRHFALGTVAIIRRALTPAEVAQVLIEQRKRPRERFGEVAVEMGLLTAGELEELLVAQQQGLFTDEEIREARSRIRAFRELESTSAQ